VLQVGIQQLLQTTFLVLDVVYRSMNFYSEQCMVHECGFREVVKTILMQ